MLSAIRNNHNLKKKQFKLAYKLNKFVSQKKSSRKQAVLKIVNFIHE